MKNPAGRNGVQTFINRILAAMCPRFVIVTKMKRTNKRKSNQSWAVRWCYNLSDVRGDYAVSQIYTEMSQIQVAWIRYCRLHVPCNKTIANRAKEEQGNRHSEYGTGSTIRQTKRLFCTVSRLALGPTQSLLLNWVQGSYPQVKRPGREVDQSSPSTAEVQNEWSYIFTFAISLLYRDNFNFPFIKHLYLCNYYGCSVRFPRSSGINNWSRADYNLATIIQNTAFCQKNGIKFERTHKSQYIFQSYP